MTEHLTPPPRVRLRLGAHSTQDSFLLTLERTATLCAHASWLSAPSMQRAWTLAVGGAVVGYLTNWCAAACAATGDWPLVDCVCDATPSSVRCARCIDERVLLQRRAVGERYKRRRRGEHASCPCVQTGRAAPCRRTLQCHVADC
eukprot:3793208-Pleurochrysis_carterae.AAC.3